MEIEEITADNSAKELTLGEQEMMDIDGEPTPDDEPILHGESSPKDGFTRNGEPFLNTKSIIEGEPMFVPRKRHRLPNVINDDSHKKEYGCDVGWLGNIRRYI